MDADGYRCAAIPSLSSLPQQVVRSRLLLFGIVMKLELKWLSLRGPAAGLECRAAPEQCEACSVARGRLGLMELGLRSIWILRICKA